MDCKTVFLDLKVPSACEVKPLMLHELLFCPALTWVCQELSVRGIQRFFVICDEKWQTEAEAALKDIPNVQFFDSTEAALAAAVRRAGGLGRPADHARECR